MLSSHAATSAIFEPRERTLLLFAGGFAFILGVMGYKEYFVATKQTSTAFDWCYNAINLFLMQFEAEGALPWKLEVARWLSPATLSYTLFKAIMAVAKDSVQAYQLKKRSGHGIILGLDKGTLELAYSMVEAGIFPVVVDSDEQNEYLGLLANKKVPFLVANPADPTILKRLNISEAKYLYAATASDSINLDIIYQNFGQQREVQLNAVCRISNLPLVQALYNRPFFNTNNINISTKIINSQKVTARWLVCNFGPDSLRSDLPSLDLIKICVVGDTKMLSALPVRLSEIGIYGGQSTLDITVINTGTVIGKEQEIHNLIGNETINEFVRVTYKELAAPSSEALQSILNFPEMHCCYVCMKEADMALVVLQTLLDLSVTCPVVVTETDNNGSFNWLVSDFSEIEHIRFAQTHKVSHSFDSIFGEGHDQIAKRIHEQYVAEQIACGLSCDSNTAMVEWDNLPETLKDANRNQADHMATKCRLLTGEPKLVTSELGKHLTSEKIEMLAEIEHRRWVVEKLLKGWRYTSGEKNVAQRLSPSLVAWSELSEPEKQKDRDTIYLLPRLIEQLQVTARSDRPQ